MLPSRSPLSTSRSLSVISLVVAAALATAAVAPVEGATLPLQKHGARTGSVRLSPARGPQLLGTIPANAFPRHPGFGDPRFGVVEAFEAPQRASDLHVGWERVQIRWDLLQPRGPLQWDANATIGAPPYNCPDCPFDHEIRQGRQLVGVIQGVPSWAAMNPTDGNRAVPRNLDLPWSDPRNYWGQFVFRAARHYAGRIDTLVIMNEVNIASGAYHQFDGTVDQYAQMLRLAYLAAHAANPHVDVHIYGDSVFADQGAWFNRTIDTLARFPNARADNFFFDAAEVHLYSSVLHWDTLIARWHAAMRAHGFDRPIWLSETNVSPRDDYVSPAHPADHNALLSDQPSFVVDSFATGLGLGFPRLEIYRMLDPRKIWPEHPNGLVRRNGTVRPEYYAFKTVNTWFAGVFAARDEPCDTPYFDRTCLFRVTMEQPGQEIVVLWNQGGKPIDARVAAIAPVATLVTPLGVTSTISAVSGRFTVALQAATDHGVASAKMFDIGSPPVIVVQDLPEGRHVAGLSPLYVERDRGANAGNALGPVSSVAFAPDGSGLHALADTTHDHVLIEDVHGHVTATLGGTGGAPGQFRGPAGVAFGSDGTLYVADMGNARVQEFDPRGNLLGGFGAYGFTPDTLRAPSAVAAAPDNTVWVVDAAQDAVLHFTRQGLYLGRFGGPGHGLGQLDGPGGIATDTAGNVYVADTLNNRVVEISGQGEPLAQFGTGDAGSGPRSLHWPTDVTVLPGGAIAIADAANARVAILTHPQTYAGSIDVSAVAAPGGLAIAPDGSYFVSDTSGNRVVHVDATGKIVGSFGSRGTGEGQFFGPLGLAIDSDGNLYVADHGNNRIEVLTQSGGFVRGLGRQGHAPGQFIGPYAVSAAPDGTLWVADDGNARIQHLTPGGGVLGADITGVNGAWGVASDGRGGIYYSAHWGQHIYHLAASGQLQGWGAPGSGAGEFDGPGALAAAPGGTAVYAVDERNARIQYISAGRVAGQRGGANSSVAGLANPVAVAVEPDGSVAVLDAARHRIVRYQGAGADEFVSIPARGLPLGVGVDADGGLVIPVDGPWSGLSDIASENASV